MVLSFPLLAFLDAATSGALSVLKGTPCLGCANEAQPLSCVQKALKKKLKKTSAAVSKIGWTDRIFVSKNAIAANTDAVSIKTGLYYSPDTKNNSIANVGTDHKPVVQVLEITDRTRSSVHADDNDQDQTLPVAIVTWNMGGNAAKVAEAGAEDGDNALFRVLEPAHKHYGPLAAVFFIGQEFAMELKGGAMFAQKMTDLGAFRGTTSAQIGARFAKMMTGALRRGSGSGAPYVPLKESLDWGLYTQAFVQKDLKSRLELKSDGKRHPMLRPTKGGLLQPYELSLRDGSFLRLNVINVHLASDFGEVQSRQDGLQQVMELVGRGQLRSLSARFGQDVKTKRGKHPKCLGRIYVAGGDWNFRLAPKKFAVLPPAGHWQDVSRLEGGELQREAASLFAQYDEYTNHWVGDDPMDTRPDMVYLFTKKFKESNVKFLPTYKFASGCRYYSKSTQKCRNSP